MGQPWNSVVCLPVFSILMWMYCCCLHSCLNPLYNLSSLLCKWINKTLILCFICGKMTNLFTWESTNTEDGMVCTVVTGKKRLYGCQPACTIIPDTMLSKALEKNSKRQSVLQLRRVTVPCNWKITYLDLTVSPGTWNGLHITSVKELCNFLNI